MVIVIAVTYVQSSSQGPVSRPLCGWCMPSSMESKIGLIYL